jgi:beta-glucanase (GH16 family)
MTWQTVRISALSLLIMLLPFCIDCNNSTEPPTHSQLVWQDEFNGPAGQSPDSTRWGYDLGTDFGNGELEYTTNRPVNVSLDGNGHLAITAQKESYKGRPYTSARINTLGLYQPTYGRIEASIQLPWGRGMWPAFWLLGATTRDTSSAGVASWPACGEIDIMENRGQQPSTVVGTLHGPGYSGGQGIFNNYSLVQDRFDTGFHIFAVEWTETAIRWYVDGNLYHAVHLGEQHGPWVFDHPFSIILNVAVGGLFVGSPDPSTLFPQTMLVDWVRVYQ